MEQGGLSNTLKRELKLLEPELFSFRRDLHRYPELSGNEIETSRKIREKLTALGYDVTNVGPTGLYTRLEGAKPGEVIMLRADIDALPLDEKSRYSYPSENPSCMHACGHDVHATALLGAAKYFAGHREDISGSVHFVFQHAEEKGHGSQDFLKEGLTEGVDHVYGFHVTPEVPLGSVLLADGPDLASCDYMKIRLYGKNAHISKPHLGCDTALCAADIAMHLRAIAGGRNPLEPVLIGIGRISSGNTWNIISDFGEIEGTVRTFSMDVRDRLLQAVEDEIKRVSALYGVRAEVTFELNTQCLVNDPKAGETAIRAAAKAVGKDHVIRRREPFGFGADDFAEFSARIPGAFLHIGTALSDREDTKLPLHSPNLYIPDEAVAIGCEVLIRCALEHLGKY